MMKAVDFEKARSEKGVSMLSMARAGAKIGPSGGLSLASPYEIEHNSSVAFFLALGLE